MGKTRGETGEYREIVIPYARTKLTTTSGKYDLYYPKGIKWSCKRCGACCRDASHRPRKILLLPSDVERLEMVGERDFIEKVKGEEPFVAEMKKRGGACINLTETGCRVYSSRALLCRMYPLWVERDGRSLEVRIDTKCPGFGHGPELKEDYFRDLLISALEERGE
jgi:Fe-S-cluster containining protein